jgi:YD repeat-containing protein
MCRRTRSCRSRSPRSGGRCLVPLLWGRCGAGFNWASISSATIRYIQSTPPTLSNEVYIDNEWTKTVETCTSTCQAGIAGSGNGQFNAPRGITVAANGDVWVADNSNNRLEEFNEKNEYLSKFGSKGTAAGQFNEPKAIAIDSTGDLWIADSANDRVQKFSPTGSFIYAIGGRGTGDGQFEEPWGIAFATSGATYITDSKNNRINIWKPQDLGVHESRAIYYTAGPDSVEPTCGEHPEWANLPCQTGPLTQPQDGGMPGLPTSTVTYNIWGETETTTEKSGSAERTSTQAYDAAGRLKESSMTSSTGKPLPTITDKYSTVTGALINQSTATEGKTKELKSEYDTLGQLISYTDAAGVTSTYDYDEDGRVTKTSDGKGTRTAEYDKTTGQLTTLKDSGAGTFTATYNTEGQLATETYPNGMQATYTANSVGQTTALTYAKGSTTWYKDQVTLSIHGQSLSQQSTLANENYTYDNYGRMTQVQEEPASKIQEEAVGKGCTTRLYTYDADSNRTSETKREPGTGGACASEGGTTTTHDYDEADRLTDPGATYEPFGENTLLPAGDAGGHTLESSYYASGSLYYQVQNGQTNTYLLDPAGRVLETTTVKGTSSKATISNYSGTGSTPSWTETEGRWTRNIAGINGALAAIQVNGGEPVLQLANLHGDIIGTSPDNSGAETTTLKSEPTAFGIPTSPSTEKYSWLGTSNLPTEFLETGIQSGSGGSYIPELGLHLASQGLSGAAAQDPANEYLANQPLAPPRQEGPETGPFPPPPSPVTPVMVPPPLEAPPVNEQEGEQPGEETFGDPIHCYVGGQLVQEEGRIAGIIGYGGCDEALPKGTFIKVCVVDLPDIGVQPFTNCNQDVLHHQSKYQAIGESAAEPCSEGDILRAYVAFYVPGGRMLYAGISQSECTSSEEAIVEVLTPWQALPGDL